MRSFPKKTQQILKKKPERPKVKFTGANKKKVVPTFSEFAKKVRQITKDQMEVSDD